MTRNAMQHKPIEPVDMNGSVHTAHKQHQRICVLASSVDWARSSDFFFWAPTCASSEFIGRAAIILASFDVVLICSCCRSLSELQCFWKMALAQVENFNQVELCRAIGQNRDFQKWKFSLFHEK